MLNATNCIRLVSTSFSMIQMHRRCLDQCSQMAHERVKLLAQPPNIRMWDFFPISNFCWPRISFVLGNLPFHLVYNRLLLSEGRGKLESVFTSFSSVNEARKVRVWSGAQSLPDLEVFISHKANDMNL